VPPPPFTPAPMHRTTTSEDQLLADDVLIMVFVWLWFLVSSWKKLREGEREATVALFDEMAEKKDFLKRLVIYNIIKDGTNLDLDDQI
jgi:hypothetical protein